MEVYVHNCTTNRFVKESFDSCLPACLPQKNKAFRHLRLFIKNTAHCYTAEYQAVTKRREYYRKPVQLTEACLPMNIDTLMKWVVPILVSGCKICSSCTATRIPHFHPVFAGIDNKNVLV